jgi:uncharacterized protein (TIGR02611 family)
MGDPEFVRMTKRHGRRVAVTVVGTVVTIVGLALCVLPGPGILTVAAGLAILATEYEWARRLLHKVRQKARETYERATGRRHDAKAERGDRPASRSGPGPDSDTA